MASRIASIACVDRRTRPGWCCLLVRLAHLVDLGHVDPVPDVIIDVVDNDVDPLRLLALAACSTQYAVVPRTTVEQPGSASP